MSLAGLCGGMVMPSRDMIVREVTPPGAFGKVFAFVTTGYHIAGILAPLLFGALLDHGAPRAVFYLTAAFTLLAIGAVACVPRRRAGMIRRSARWCCSGSRASRCGSPSSRCRRSFR